MKVYTLSYGGAEVGQALIEAARRKVEECLKQSAGASGHYGVGFVGIHQGKGGNFVFVDWWADENELHHHVYVSPSDRPAELDYRTPTGLTACAWDLYLIGHERDAWVEHVLRHHTAPDIEAYLRARLNKEL